MSDSKITDLQKRTMESFLEVAGKKTMTEYGDLLGIERTRFFRLLHGAEMKMREFEKFQIFLDKNRVDTVDWEREIQQTQRNSILGDEASSGVDLGVQWDRNIRLRELVAVAQQSRMNGTVLTA